MNIDLLRTYLLSLPHAEETMQWGDNLVFWVGDKTLGGKMFALADLSGEGKAVFSFCAGPERYHQLLEIDGIFPAPYLARAFWVALEHYDALPSRELKEELLHGHDLVYNKLTRRTRELLALPKAAQKRAAAKKKAAKKTSR
jgi:predicted DNA-binding protein (MmcQ/YjbR family)